MRRLWAVVAVGVGLAGNAGASRYEIPLPELKGVYSTGDWGPYRRTASFDAGYAFERVDSIRIHVTGTIAPALEPPIGTVSGVLGQNGSGSPTELVSVFPAIEFSIRSADHADTGRGTLLAGKAFDAEIDSTPLRYDDGTATYRPVWDFLPRGRGEVDISLVPILSGQVVPALAGIADAYLVIDGVASPVPEPGAGLVLLPAVLLLGRRRRKVD